MPTFSDFNLSTPIAKAIEALGFEKPSPIQAQTLPLLLDEPTDFIGLAATGTGKTAAFAIPLLEKIDPNARGVQALILCPTRELALQVATQINLIGRFKRVRSVAIYGGASYGEQIRGLRDGAQVVVGTPGRVVDHLERGTLVFDQLKTLILDEADEMISMGFKDELEKILGSSPRESSNIWLFSATMSREVRRVADSYLRAPKQVQVNRQEVLSATVEQFYYPVQESNKPDVLCKLIEAAEDFYGLVFCQTKALVVDLMQGLTDRGYKVDSLHGDKDQKSRERTMQAFRDRRVTILVCTDVAARGLDVKDITHVVNYSLPRELENYVHRIGRTARSGKTGIAMNLVTPSHRRLVYSIESHTKSKMQEGRIPSRREIGARKVGKHIASFMEQPFHSRAVEVMGEEWKTALANMTAEEVAGRFLAMMMPEVFNDRMGAPAAEPKMTAPREAFVPRAPVQRESAPRPSVPRASASASAPAPRPQAPRPAPQPAEKFTEKFTEKFARNENELPQSTEEFIEAFQERKRPVGRQPFQRERDSRPGGMRMNSRPRQTARSEDQRGFKRNFDSRPAPAERLERPRGPRLEENRSSEEPSLMNRKARRALKFAHLDQAQY